MLQIPLWQFTLKFLKHDLPKSTHKYCSSFVSVDAPPGRFACLIQFVPWEQTSVNAFSYYYYFFFLKSLAQIFQIPLLQFTLKFLKQDLTKGETNTVAPLIRSMLHPEVFPVSHLGCFESEQV